MAATLPGAVNNADRDRRHHSLIRLQGPSLEFRDEQIYLKSIAPYVSLTRSSQKGKEKEQEGSPEYDEGSEVVEIQWRKVLWITTRDHLLTPLIRGLVWGIAGQYVTRITGIFAGSRKSSQTSGRAKEGQGVGWLRKWISHLTSGVKTSMASPRGLEARPSSTYIDI